MEKGIRVRESLDRGVDVLYDKEDVWRACHGTQGEKHDARGVVEGGHIQQDGDCSMTVRMWSGLCLAIPQIGAGACSDGG